MKLRLISICLAVLLALTACTKQTPEMPPGTAIIINLKGGIHIAQVATASAKDALPDLMKNADAEDIATANQIVGDVDKALTGLDKKLAPYSSFDSSNQKEIKQAVEDTLGFLKEMQAGGVTHIKNAKLQARVNLGLTLATGALALWQPQAVSA